MHFRLWRLSRFAVVAGSLLAGSALANSSQAQETGLGEAEVDTALVVSVDVSNSVDERRYQLQMNGIATALEDSSVMDAILSGPQGGIAIAMVVWADRPKTAIPWTVIRNKDDAAAVAQKIRKLPREGGEFTCVASMLRNIADKLVTQIPVKANRTVVDVSGDGSENCNPVEPIETIRDELVEAGVTINGLPILDGKEKATLEEWYTANVKGGPSGFVLPANGFDDFPRAIRQKFVIEMSAVEPKEKAVTR